MSTKVEKFTLLIGLADSARCSLDSLANMSAGVVSDRMTLAFKRDAHRAALHTDTLKLLKHRAIVEAAS